MKSIGTREEVYQGLAKATGYSAKSLKKEDIVYDEESGIYFSVKGYAAYQRRQEKENKRAEKKEKNPEYRTKYGTRVEVMSGLAHMTTSGLCRGDLVEKDGVIMSVREAGSGARYGGEMVVDGVRYSVTLTPLAQPAVAEDAAAHDT